LIDEKWFFPQRFRKPEHQLHIFESIIRPACGKFGGGLQDSSVDGGFDLRQVRQQDRERFVQLVITG